MDRPCWQREERRYWAPSDPRPCSTTSPAHPPRTRKQTNCRAAQQTRNQYYRWRAWSEVASCYAPVFARNPNHQEASPMHDSKIRSRLKAQLTKFSSELCEGRSEEHTSE